MPNDTDGRSAPRDVSRRHLFKQVGLAGAAAAVAGAVPGVITANAQPAPAAEPTTTAAAPKPPAALPATPLAAPRLEALETLTAAEADTLEAIVARLIPTDENGPGATEARAAHYIDRALTGPLRASRASLCRQVSPPSTSTRRRRKARRSPSSRRPIRMPCSPTWRRTSPPASRPTRPRSSTSCAPHHPGHVLRSLLRRQREFRRLGPDRLSRHPRMAVTADEQRMKTRAKPERALGLCRRGFAMFGASKGGGHGHRP